MSSVSTLKQTDEPSRPARKAYERPCIEWEEDFEPAGQSTGCADVGDNCPERPET